MATSLFPGPSSQWDMFSDPLFEGGFDPSVQQQQQQGIRRRAVMPVDVVETPDAFVMYVDCAGCRKEDVGVEVDGSVVRVRCNFKMPLEYNSDKVKWHRAGRPFGTHERRLRFPDSCNIADIEAKVQDGTLCVTISKHPDAKVHRIQINSSAPSGAEGINE